MTPEEAVNARQPEESDGQHFVRKFRIGAEDLADESAEHVANMEETVADAIRRGLRPTGEPEHVSTEPGDPGHVVATYRVPVAVTQSAATVSAEGEQENDPAQTTLDDRSPSEPANSPDGPEPEWPTPETPVGTDNQAGA